MNKRTTFAAVLSTALCAVALTATTPGEGTMAKSPSVYDFTMKSIDGKDVKLSSYAGGVLLIVNVASK